MKKKGKNKRVWWLLIFFDFIFLIFQRSVCIRNINGNFNFKGKIVKFF